MADTLGKDNPYRFKGYYYDEETGMYYLKSRYYQLEICRFISADSYAVLTQSPMALVDTNLYNYCDNNPVYREDENGQFWNVVIPALIGAAVGTFLTWAATSATGQEYTTKDYLSDFAAGFIINLIPVKNIARAVNVIYTTGKGIYDGEEPKSIAFNAAIAWTASSLNISERLNIYFNDYRNKDIIVNDIYNDVITYYMLDLLLGNIDNGKYNYEFMVSDTNAKMSPYSDFGMIFNFSSTKLRVNEYCNSSIYDNLNVLLSMNKEYLTRFSSMYEKLTPNKLEEIINDVEKNNKVDFGSNFKNIIFLSYSRHYVMLGNIINTIKKNSYLTKK